MEVRRALGSQAAPGLALGKVSAPEGTPLRPRNGRGVRWEAPVPGAECCGVLPHAQSYAEQLLQASFGATNWAVSRAVARLAELWQACRESSRVPPVRQLCRKCKGGNCMTFLNFLF